MESHNYRRKEKERRPCGFNSRTGRLSASKLFELLILPGVVGNLEYFSLAAAPLPHPPGLCPWSKADAGKADAQGFGAPGNQRTFQNSRGHQLGAQNRPRSHAIARARYGSHVVNDALVDETMRFTWHSQYAFARKSKGGHGSPRQHTTSTSLPESFEQKC
jgi:hypothetical protein